MSPDVKKILKLLLFPLLVIAALVAWHFFSTQLSTETLDNLDNVKTYGIIALSILLGVAVVVFLFYNLFREIYTSGIKRRADKIMDVRMDEKNAYLFIETDCFQSGGDTGDSYYIYQYYLFHLETGRRFVYRAKHAKRAPDKAISFFKEKIPRTALKLNHMELKPDRVIETPDYKIKIKPFKTRFDFGFEVTCRHKSIHSSTWKSKI